MNDPDLLVAKIESIKRLACANECRGVYLNLRNEPRTRYGIHFLQHGAADTVGARKLDYGAINALFDYS